MSIRKGKIITITSRKGGVGKTVFATNLAGAYHLLKKKVLLIDLDLYSGGIAISLNLNIKKDIYDLIEDLKNNRYKQFEDYITPYNASIDVLASPLDPLDAKRIENEYITKIISYAKNKYDAIIIDTTHVLSDINLHILDNSDKTIFLITNDPIDLKNIKTMLNIYKDLEKKNYYIVLNESRDTGKDYFSLFDIRTIIKNNIDYTISKSFYIKSIDKYSLDGEILILNNSVRMLNKKDANMFTIIANDMLKGDE